MIECFPNMNEALGSGSGVEEEKGKGEERREKRETHPSILRNNDAIT